MNAHNEIHIPPQSLEAEQSVLGGLMLNNEAIDRIGELKPEHFFLHQNRQIFEQIAHLISQNKPADVVTVFDAMKASGKTADLEYLNGLAQETPSVANIGRYAEIVREKALLRGMVLAAYKVQDIVESSLPAAEKLDAAQGEFAKLATQTVQREPVTIQSAMRRYIDDLDDRYQGQKPQPGISTRLIDLDKILNGGVRRGALVTLGARPGMGKSALGETISLNAALAGHSVLFLSMEMPEAEVVERSLAIVGKISASILAAANKEMDSTDTWPRLTYAVQMMQDTCLHVDDEPGLSLLQVVTKARSIKRKAGLDLLVVDYLQLMTGTEEKRYQQIEAITKGLKVLAKTLDIAVIALSQLNREVEKRVNKRPMSSDFRDSGSIEQDSDILLGLYREEQDNPDTDNKGFAELYVLKNRQGRTGKMGLTYIGEQMRFENFSGVMPEPERKSRKKGFSD